MTDLPLLPEPELSDIALEKADANGICPVIDYYTADQMREYAKAAVKAERDACARVCADDESGRDSGGYYAEIIRARNQRTALDELARIDSELGL